MKSVLLILLCCSAFWSQSQTITRQSGESSDSFVKRSLAKDAFNAGPVFEYTNDTSSIILYVQVQHQDTSKTVTIGSETYKTLPEATYTLLCVLYSTDEVHYANYVVDTLDVNSGCCPCWQPVTVTNFFSLNWDNDPEQEIGMVVMQWVQPDCNSATISSVSIYDNITSFLTNKQLPRLRERLSENSFTKELEEDQPVIPGYIMYDF